MYLIFNNKQEAEERNLIEGFRRGFNAKNKTRFCWSVAKEYEDGRVALRVDDAEGLSEEELNRCIETLE